MSDLLLLLFIVGLVWYTIKNYDLSNVGRAELYDPSDPFPAPEEKRESDHSGQQVHQGHARARSSDRVSGVLDY